MPTNQDRCRTLFLLLTCLFSGLLTLQSTPADSLATKRAALNFIKGKTGLSYSFSAEPTLAYTLKKENTDCIRIYNLERGFVITSADDNAEPILGYATTGHFDPENIPENMQAYLQQYATGIRAAAKAKARSADIRRKWEMLTHTETDRATRSSGTTVEPLIQTYWNQNTYYNLYCPADSNGPGGHAYAGCVGTAMAQIMRYWQYPASGSGTQTYTTQNYGQLTVYYDNQTYNYDNMPGRLTANSTSTQKSAVAKLIYHCAASVKTAFGSGSSGAFNNRIAPAFKTYFKYSPDSNANILTEPTYVEKANYTDDQWTALLKNELDNRRPVLYAGAGSVGHAFVCDGYDDQGYFHFNWGWGGLHDGYFLIGSLNPTSARNYNLRNIAVIGIQGGTPIIQTASNNISLVSPLNATSESKIITYVGTNLTENVQVTVSGNFSISLDDVNFTNNLSINATSGQIYLRYIPSGETPATDRGTLVFSANAAQKTIALTGRSYQLQCKAPQNLTATQGQQQINLTWDAPQTPEPETYPLSWDSVASMHYKYGQDLLTVLCQRYCDSDLVAYHNKTLTRISFIPINPAHDYKIVVYTGGSIVDGLIKCGTRIVEQTVDSLTYNTWNTVTLTNPVTIDANQELWYGIQFKDSVGAFPIVTGNIVYYPEKGDLISVDGSDFFCWNYGRNFSLKAYIEDPVVTVESYDIYQNGNFTGNTGNSSYQISGIASGTPTYQVQANWSNGCTAAAETTLETGIPCPLAEVHNITDTACNGYVWNGQLYTQSGDYTQTLQSVSGCDSIVTLHLTVNSSKTHEFSATACNGYVWNGQLYTQTGDYTQTLQTVNGCDSTVTLHLTVNSSIANEFSDTACNGYDWNGIIYNQSGDYTQTLQTSNGCDSTVTLHLVINQPTDTTIYETACMSYQWQDETLSQSGIYTRTLTAQNGCDSVMTLDLTITQPTDTIIYERACESYTWYGIILTESGKYTQTYTSVTGCDSSVTLNLTILPNYTVFDTLRLRMADLPYYFAAADTTIVTAPTVFSYTRETVDGCDSTIIMTVFVTDVNIPTFDEFGLSIYPNPTTDRIFVEGDNIESISLFNITGQLIGSQPVSSKRTEMALNNLAEGIYLIKVRFTDRHETTKKIVIRKGEQ